MKMKIEFDLPEDDIERVGLVSDVLEKIVYKFEMGDRGGRIRDIYGNAVGDWYTEEA